MTDEPISTSPKDRDRTDAPPFGIPPRGADSMAGSEPAISPLKRILDNHPLVLLVAVAVSVAVAAAGATTFFAKQLSALTQAKHDRQVQELQTRLVSIERRLGGQTSFFDVTRVLITPDQTRTLPQTVQFLPELRIYVSAPQDPQWVLSTISEVDLIALHFGPEIVDSMPRAVRDAGRRSRLTMWKAPKDFKVDLRQRTGHEGRQLTLFSYVIAQRLDRKIFQIAANAVAEVEEEAHELKRLLQDLAKAGREETSGGRSTKEATIQALSEIVDHDLVTTVLIGQLVGGQSMTREYENVAFRVLNAQKKGNVLYCQLQTVFHGTGPDKSRPSDITLDRELFVVATPKDIVTIITAVPSTGAAQQDQAWIAQWLSTLYVPMEM